jgi:hydrophobe/amphiphile efflux-3 (HAE3) family protein
MRPKLDVGALLGRVTSFSARRAPLVVAVVVGLSLVAALLALRLDSSASISTFVDRDGKAAAATDDLHRKFGDEPIVILVRGKLTGLLLTQDLGRMLGLEGCISGNQPPKAKAPAPVCREFAQRKPVQVVYGPGTFINEAAGQVLDRINFGQARQRVEADRAARAARQVARARGLAPADQNRLARAARQVVNAKYSQRALEVAVRYGLNSLPALNNPEFVLQLVFAPRLGGETPKPRFAYLFPNPNAAVIQARLRPGMSDGERREAIDMVRRAVASKPFKLQFGSYVVSGTPVVTEGVSASLSDALRVLLVAVVLVMAATLALVFRVRRRLLPLALALAAAALTFGAMWVAGASLTIASIALLPVLVGLAVDYAVQFQSRFNEAEPGPARAQSVARTSGPVIATAGAATAAGFLVLLLSPVPMVRSFGLLLVIGIVLAFAVTLTAGFAVLAGERQLSEALAPLTRRLSRLRLPHPRLRVSPSLPDFVKRAGRGAFQQALRRPGRVLGIALALAAIGWVAGTQVEVVSDIQRLVPGDQREVSDLNTLQRFTGSSGDVNVIVRSERLLDPKVVAWMAGYQSRVLRQNGFREGKRCREAQLCPALSLTNLFGSGRQSARQIEQIVAALPRYFSQNVITADRRTANIAFGIRSMPLDRQKQLIDRMRAELDPPPGVDAELAGLPVLAADANDSLESSRWLLALASLVAVFLVLLAVYRRLEAAVIPLVPIALATGWSSLLLFALQIPLNPMSATLGALVIAISTEFAVLLSGRYREERAAGLEPAAALERTYERTGAAVLASSTTAIAGFAVLLVSDFPMLRDFGAVTLVSLSVSLLGVMIVLPATLLWVEQRGPLATWHGVRNLPAAVRRAVPKAGRRIRAVVPSRK